MRLEKTVTGNQYDNGCLTPDILLKEDDNIVKTNGIAVLYALLAAVFYALNTPASKLLLEQVPPTFMAAFLYLGAGVGVGLMYLPHIRQEAPGDRLKKEDLLYTAGMILLDILAPIFLMLGIRLGTASGASLLGNFEIVATTLIALLLFRETVTGRLWIAIGFICASSILLSFDGTAGFRFSFGSLFVLLATACWGLENNCTRKIADKSTYQIVLLKGIFSGGGSFCIACLLREPLPDPAHIFAAMVLGFVAYGLSIFLYIRAQRTLGAAKTSAYYAVAPFVGALLSFTLVGEPLSGSYLLALGLMLIGSGFVVWDTMVKHHTHMHTHTVTHTHNGITHTHTFAHSHGHDHFGSEEKHGHSHTSEALMAEHAHSHESPE